ESDRFDELHAWIASHLDEELTVERLAEQAGMSVRTFARTYSTRLGRTPAKTVEAMRVEAACRLLEETSYPMKRIAFATGHIDEQNMRRVFMRRMGINPGQYRLRFSAHHTDNQQHADTV
ncbi:transcriptional regulator GlxA family with amidase domain, partial [Oxalobacteraceae bacterium GrIS 2.11]